MSRTGRRLLELADGGIALRDAFPLMHAREQRYYVTDATLAGLAETLSRISPALLTLDMPNAAEDGVLQGHLALTETGRSV